MSAPRLTAEMVQQRFNWIGPSWEFAAALRALASEETVRLLVVNESREAPPQRGSETIFKPCYQPPGETMKITASFEEGSLHLVLTTETEAEQRMVGAVLEQPQSEEGCASLDKSLISASLDYDGHWSNKRIKRVKLSVFRPTHARIPQRDKP